MRDPYRESLTLRLKGEKNNRLRSRHKQKRRAEGFNVIRLKLERHRYGS